MSDSLEIGLDVDSKEFVPAVVDCKAGDNPQHQGWHSQMAQDPASAVSDWHGGDR